VSNAATVPQSVLFPDLFERPLVASFDQPDTSSDGGAVLLKAADRRLGLLDALAAAWPDERAAHKVQHTVHDLLAQRVFGIACGHPDGNDADALADDPIYKLLLDRDPLTGRRLASQPSLSRFEHRARPRPLYRLAEALADVVIARHRRRHRRARLVTVDLDVTADPTHGAQQLSFFNGFYDTWCYLPLVATLTFDAEPRQYVVATILRPGNAATAIGVRHLVRQLLPKLWAAFPKAQLRVRLDGGFATPALFNELDAAGVEYLIGMARNSRLAKAATPLLRPLRRAARQTGETATSFGETTYQARTWPHARRVVIKAEVTCQPGRERRDNPRFVVTNLRQSPAWIYQHVYCARGDSENRLKELHRALALGRTSCTRFWANQLRVLLSAAAFVLLQELQLHADRTTLAGAQVERLRQAVLTIGTRVTRSVRRLVLHFPATHPHVRVWHQLAQRLGAVAR
jgi:hypothetical protein